jgi:formylglycine-generating enzyme required for sulfatase activity
VAGVWLLPGDVATADTQAGCRRKGCKLNIDTMKCVCPRPKAVQPTTVQWVTIPGGSFSVGSNWYPDERPAHRVTVATFQMGKTEVTVGQYRRCVQAGRCTAPDSGNYCNWGKARREDYPVNCVDWAQARAFATWAGGRLASEAEWEFAARSGGKNQKYPWGDEEPTCRRAVMQGDKLGCGLEDTWPVCSKRAGNSAQGLCDLAGNVWEWVQDVYHDTYQGAPTDGTAWEIPAGTDRVGRGGCWQNGGGGLRAGRRAGSKPGMRSHDFGFRVARSIP